jgi:hypothetical protein
MVAWGVKAARTSPFFGSATAQASKASHAAQQLVPPRSARFSTTCSSPLGAPYEQVKLASLSLLHLSEDRCTTALSDHYVSILVPSKAYIGPCRADYCLCSIDAQLTVKP